MFVYFRRFAWLRDQRVSSRSLVFFTGNAKKFAEASALLPSMTLKQMTQPIPEYQGDAVEIAKLKCIYARQLMTVDEAYFVEDTSLSFTALGGLPGPYVKVIQAAFLSSYHSALCFENWRKWTLHATFWF